MNIARKVRTAIRVYRQTGLQGVGMATAELMRRSIGLSAARDHSYAAWIDQFDTLTAADIERLRERTANLGTNPLISVLLPVYNVRDELLVEAIESVRQQIYPNWELCIVDDASTEPHVCKTLDKFSRLDPRIRVVFRTQNGHISRASNTALEMARGEWIALLDHDDLLRPHSLSETVVAISESPKAKIVYSDEDKLDENGHRCLPYFKPDWNYELFLSHNILAHLAVFKTQEVRAVGGFREGFEGAQDYDLALRIVERCTEGEILHVPRVLYHWRRLPGSTALSADEKPYAMAAGERALNEHLKRTNTRGQAKLIKLGYQIVYEVPKPEPKVSILIPTRDRLDLLRACVASIRLNTDYTNWEICIIDNNSVEPETRNWLVEVQNDSRIRVVEDSRDFNYSRLNNLAAANTSGEYILFLNNDIEVITAGWLHEMVGICAQPRVGAVGARLWYPNKTLQHGGVIIGLGGVAAHSHCGLPEQSAGYMGRATMRQDLSAVTGACMLTRREAFVAAGGLDEEHLKVAYNDIDYCLKLRTLGWRIVWTPFAELYHYESASRGSDEVPEQKQRFEREQSVMKSRWKTWMDHDPAYNPNLSLDNTMFTLAFPPRISTFPDRASDVQT